MQEMHKTSRHADKSTHLSRPLPNELPVLALGSHFLDGERLYYDFFHLHSHTRQFAQREPPQGRPGNALQNGVGGNALTFSRLLFSVPPLPRGSLTAFPPSSPLPLRLTPAARGEETLPSMAVSESPRQPHADQAPQLIVLPARCARPEGAAFDSDWRATRFLPSHLAQGVDE